MAHQIEKRYSEKGNKQLTIEEVKVIVDELAAAPMMEPFINDASSKMASRDVAFRDAWHGNLAEYLRAVTPDEFDKFIGDASIDFDNILEANREVLKRLKQADDDELGTEIYRLRGGVGGLQQDCRCQRWGAAGRKR